jgi:hypothetical protein
MVSYLVDELGFHMIPFPLSSRSDIMGSRSGYPWQGLEYLSDAYQRCLFGENGYFAQMATHLRAKGWLDVFYLEVWHEPQCAKDDTGWREAYRLAQLVKNVDPGIRVRIDGACPDLNPVAELFPLVDNWGVYLSMTTLDDMLELREKNKTLLTTSFNGTWLIDFPAVYTRILPWLVWRNRFDGYLHYSIFASMDPWENSRTYREWLAASSVRNGDNMFVYPMRRTDVDQPYLVNSIRWELEREGIEDFEYLWLLRDRIEKLDRLGTAPRELETARNVLVTAENLVRRPAKTRELTEFLHDFETDPQKLYQARETVAEQIEIIGRVLGL